MRIALLVEGKTERVFLPYLREFVNLQLGGMARPRIDGIIANGRVNTHEKLRRQVIELLRKDFDHVVALTDVYTGSNPPEFKDATDARQKMRTWVGPEPRFHPHAAQHDFEAWLLPYWPTIRKMANRNTAAPKGLPESVNHGKPPAHRLRELFESEGRTRSYSKTRDADAILRKCGLTLAVEKCPELKSLVNTILTISDGMPIP